MHGPMDVLYCTLCACLDQPAFSAFVIFGLASVVSALPSLVTLFYDSLISRIVISSVLLVEAALSTNPLCYLGVAVVLVLRLIHRVLLHIFRSKIGIFR